MPKPSRAAVIETASEFAKCLFVFFVLPPTLTVTAYYLAHLVR